MSTLLIVTAAGAEPYLETLEATLTWAQLYNVDIYALLILSAVLLFGAAAALLWAGYNALSRKTNISGAGKTKVQ